MGGTGDIGGGCVVSFAVDAEAKGDRKRRWSAFDKHAEKQPNQTKIVTITARSSQAGRKLLCVYG